MALLMNIEINDVAEAVSHINAQVEELRQVFMTDLKQAQQPITDGAWVGEGQKMFTTEMVDKIYSLAEDLMADLSSFGRVVYAAANDVNHVDGVIKTTHVQEAEQAFAAIIK